MFTARTSCSRISVTVHRLRDLTTVVADLFPAYFHRFSKASAWWGSRIEANNGLGGLDLEFHVQRTEEVIGRNVLI